MSPQKTGGVLTDPVPCNGSDPQAGHFLTEGVVFLRTPRTGRIGDDWAARQVVPFRLVQQRLSSAWPPSLTPAR